MGSMYDSMDSFFVKKLISSGELRTDLKDYYKIAQLSAVNFAYRLLPTPIKQRSKTAAILPDILSYLDASESTYRIINDAINLGEGPPVAKLESKYKDYDKAKAIARTAMLNYYTKVYIQQWAEAGLELTKRVEMHDHKTCPICRSLNGNIFTVDELLLEDNPLTYVTHPNCRGSYSPYMAQLSNVRPLRPKMRNINIRGNSARNTPPEVAPFLSHIFLREKMPFDIDFSYDKKAPLTSLSGNTLTIGNYHMGDTDVREVVLAEKANMLWKTWEKVFLKEYMPMVYAGIVDPVRNAASPREVFIDSYVAYAMRQFDDVHDKYPIYWFSKNFK